MMDTTLTTRSGPRIDFLGGLRITGLEPGGFGYDKMRALLAYLALEARTHSREALAELLWPGNEAGRGNLRRTLADLRRALPDGDTLFVADRHSLRLAEQVAVDAREFLLPPGPCQCQRCAACLAHLEHCAALYRGELLPGHDCADSAEFEDWLAARREALRCHALALFEHLAVQHEQQGRPEHALPFARRLVELEPWLESGQRRLIGLLARLGQRSAALAQYDAFRQLLLRDLGSHPEPATQALAKAVRAGELEPASAPQVRSLAAAPAGVPSERRQVTVLYCELALEAPEGGLELDPEEALERLAQPQARVRAAIEAHGGHVVQSHGGGLLAYFGYPLAREHAAREAAAAARALTAAAAPLGLRAGLHTGPILCSPGDALPDLAGPTSARAVALRQRAPMGAVLASEATRQVLAGYFRFDAAGDGAFLLGAATGAADRLSAAVSLAPFTGRAAELARLRAHWHDARAGRGGGLFLCADPGLGKSRLLLELQACEQAPLLALRCLESQRDQPFHPLQGLADTDAVLARCLADEHTPPSSRLARLAERLLGAAAEARLIILEDAHWADPSTLELLREMLPRLAGRPVLLLISARPELQLTAPGLARLDLAPFDHALAIRLARALPFELSDDEREQVVARADGVPLFIEELAGWRAAAERNALPPSLDQLLGARLDQLGEGRRLAQLAACIGREVDPVLLDALLVDQPELARSLPALLDSGLLRREADVLLFKHALIHEAARAAQPLAARRLTHARIASLMTGPFAARYQAQPTVLAQHLAAAGDIRGAIAEWRRAGDMALRLSAHTEAARHFRQALALLAQLPAETARDALELPLQIGLGTALNGAVGYGAEETSRVFARARALCQDGSDQRMLLQALFGVWAGAASWGTHFHGSELADEMMAVADATGRPELMLMALFAKLSSVFWFAPLSQSRTLAEDFIARAERTDSAACIAVFAEDPQTIALAFLCRGLWFEGRTADAIAASDRAIARARAQNFAHSLCFALTFSAQMYRCIGDVARVRELEEETLGLAEQNGLAVWRAAANGLLGWAAAAEGRDEGVARAWRGWQAMRESLSSVEVSYGVVYLAACARRGKWSEILADVDGIMARGHNRGDTYLLPEMLMLKARALVGLEPGRREEALALVDQALHDSQTREAWALHAQAQALRQQLGG